MVEPWLDEEQQRVWRAWLAVTARLPVVLHRALQASSGLSLTDFDVLVQLSEERAGRLRVGALAEALQWERSRVSHHVTRMQRRGLVERDDCDDDGRGAWVVLTDQGRAAIEGAAPDHVRLVRELVFAERPAGSLSVLQGMLDDIAARLDAVDEREAR